MNRTLLIVDDEPETLKGYAEFLASSEAGKPARRSSRSSPAEFATRATEAESYTLLLAGTGEKAIELAKREKDAGRQIAGGFFDVKLEGGIDGLETIRRVQEIDPTIHTVVVTAYHDRSVDEIQSLFGGQFKDQWDYLNKPFTRGEILQKARQMIASWNRRRQVEEMHEQLVRSERFAGIGQVARGIGHEFGNILLRIIGKTDLALLETDVVKIHDHLKVVLRAADRASVIVRNLQTISRLTPQLHRVRASVPLDEALSLVQHELVKANVTVSKSTDGDPEISIDTGKIAQVFLNLFINAVQAMPPGGGTLGIRMASAPSSTSVPGVRITVADSGNGIPADVLPRIFEYAFTTKGDQGSGIGLSVSREIIEAHGGEITVKSSPGAGTEFTVWIPASGASIKS